MGGNLLAKVVDKLGTRCYHTRRRLGDGPLGGRTAAIIAKTHPARSLLRFQELPLGVLVR